MESFLEKIGLSNIEKYTSQYFLKSWKILKNYHISDAVTVQFYCLSKTLYVCNLEIIMQIIKEYLGKHYNEYTIKINISKKIIKKREPILEITGQYWRLIKLENIIIGILVRLLATYNKILKSVKNLSKRQKIIFMADRNDYFKNNEIDGLAAYYAGVRYFTTKAHCKLIKDKKNINIIGTIPHILIQHNNGDLTKTLTQYIKTFPNDKVIGLVDYNNNIIRETLKILANFKNIFAIRIDTATGILDESIARKKSIKKEDYGVSVKLINHLNDILSKTKNTNVKIIVSGNITSSKIERFNKNKCKINYFGIGSDAIDNKISITCDGLKLNNKMESKKGRSYEDSKNLKIIK